MGLFISGLAYGLNKVTKINNPEIAAQLVLPDSISSF